MPLFERDKEHATKILANAIKQEKITAFDLMTMVYRGDVSLASIGYKTEPDAINGIYKQTQAKIKKLETDYIKKYPD